MKILHLQGTLKTVHFHLEHSLSWCVFICASTYECHRNELQWCPGRCSGVPVAPSSLAWCQVSRVSRCLGEKPVWTINPHYIPMKGWPGKMWGTEERTHPKSVNTCSKDDSSLYTSSVSFWSPVDVWPRNKQISFLVSAYIETNFHVVFSFVFFGKSVSAVYPCMAEEIHKMCISRTVL